jgi:hypothetical protein
LISNIDGILGLFIGISFVSFFEFVEIFVQIVFKIVFNDQKVNFHVKIFLSKIIFLVKKLQHSYNGPIFHPITIQILLQIMLICISIYIFFSKNALFWQK